MRGDLIAVSLVGPCLGGSVFERVSIARPFCTAGRREISFQAGRVADERGPTGLVQQR